jgi:fused signal recognition particle receptor
LGIFSKLKEGLSKTKKNVSTQLGNLISVFTGGDDFYDELEEILILADLGAQASSSVVLSLREKARNEKLKTPEDIKKALADILTEMLVVNDSDLMLNTTPSIILVIGVNGVGKTTTIGKLALKFKNEGKKVLLCAGDTFRAAAGEQLSIWAERAGADIVRRDEGADPASVIFDGINASKARGVDIIICDTAGRLHNKSNLMNELNKISRVINRELPDADRETLLVLDATTGQNGLIQARQFNETANITGVVLTKLDGTAKGGIVYAIAKEIGVPVKYIGVGEKPDDLLRFNGREFSEAILEE